MDVMYYGSVKGWVRAHFHEKRLYGIYKNLLWIIHQRMDPDLYDENCVIKDPFEQASYYASSFCNWPYGMFLIRCGDEIYFRFVDCDPGDYGKFV